MKKIGLVPKLLISIVLGVLIGLFMPEWFIRIIVTGAELFSSFLKFIVPLMIVGFVVKGISDLTQGAGKLLGITTMLAYVSTIVAGFFAFFVAINLFPNFMSNSSMLSITNPEENILKAFFTIDMPPMLDVVSAIVFSFIMGLCISTMRGKKIGNVTYDLFTEFSEIIVKVLNTIVIPLLPLYILGTFANIAYSGEITMILSVLWKVLLTVIVLHFLYMLFIFTISGIIGKKNPFVLMKNQIPGYLTAVGTQSSAACIPVNLDCAEKNGTSKQIREFVIPLCANIHMAGSIITITCCVTSVLMMFGMEYNFNTMFPLILALGIAMVASPGAPGGAIMSALPFFAIVGINPESAIASLLIALYITQDSFGTACNVSCNGAFAVIIDTVYKRFILKGENKEEENLEKEKVQV